jgi:hypothetical protein
MAALEGLALKPQARPQIPGLPRMQTLIPYRLVAAAGVAE